MIEVGDKAPEFTAHSQGGEISLSDYRGKKVALYFYPKDYTPGCTKQACNLRDNIGLLLSNGIVVIGVSKDSVKSHTNFANKYELPFPLVSDHNKKIMEAYGVWGEKSMFGKTFFGVKRTTFLIDEEGVIQHVFKRPKVVRHAEEVLQKAQGS